MAEYSAEKQNEGAQLGLGGPQFHMAYMASDESWSDFIEPGGTGSQIADPLDLFGFQAGKDAADAAKAQAAAALKAQKFLEEQYATLKATQMPFIKGGQEAFGLQAALAGLLGPDAKRRADDAYAGALSGAVAAGMPSIGKGIPVGLAQALGAYGQGIAGNDYENYFNRLGYGASLGQAAASALGGVNVDISRGIAGAMQARGDAATNNMLMQQQIRSQGLSNLATIGGAAIQGYGNYQNMQNQNKLYSAGG